MLSLLQVYSVKAWHLKHIVRHPFRPTSELLLNELGVLLCSAPDHVDILAWLITISRTSWVFIFLKFHDRTMVCYFCYNIYFIDSSSFTFAVSPALSWISTPTSAVRSQTFLCCGRLDFGASYSYFIFLDNFLSLVISVEVSRGPSPVVIGIISDPVDPVVLQKSWKVEIHLSQVVAPCITLINEFLMSPVILNRIFSTILLD